MKTTVVIREVGGRYKWAVKYGAEIVKRGTEASLDKAKEAAHACKRHNAKRTCDCGNEAVAVRFHAPVCARCLRLESASWAELRVAR